RKRSDSECWPVEKCKCARTRRRRDRANDAHERILVESPLQLEALQAAETELDDFDVRGFKNARIDKPRRNRFEARLRIEQLDSKGVSDRIWPPSVDDLKYFVGRKLCCQDQITFFNPPDVT